jgi:hypothetical protein
VLDPEEKAAFDGLVTQMRSSDPGFTRRVDRLSRPRPRIRMALAVLLWTFAPISLVVGGWTGALMALLAVAYGISLFRKRHGTVPASLPFRRTASW